MTTDEFFERLAELPIRWVLTGFREQCIRSYEGMTPSEEFSPLELVCYSHGGTVSWLGGRLHRPSLLDVYWQHGKILGLPDPDVHSIFRASDNEVEPQHEKDFEMRKRLMKACKNPFSKSYLLFAADMHKKGYPGMRKNNKKDLTKEQKETNI